MPVNEKVVIGAAARQLHDPMALSELIRQRKIREPQTLRVLTEQELGGDTLHPGCPR